MEKELIILLGCFVVLILTLRWLYKQITAPHNHVFETSVHPGVRFAQCWCGAGISLEEAAKTNTPVYWKNTGGRRVEYRDEWLKEIGVKRG
jgi:hypothetical protein